MGVIHLNQRNLAQRWHVSEATLERWRSDGNGTKFLTTVTNQGKTRWMIIDEAFNSDKLIEFLASLRGLGSRTLARQWLGTAPTLVFLAEKSPTDKVGL